MHARIHHPSILVHEAEPGREHEVREEAKAEDEEEEADSIALGLARGDLQEADDELWLRRGVCGCWCGCVGVWVWE